MNTEKKPKERFETLPTHLPGIQLRVRPGTKLDILRKTIEGLYQLAKEFAKTKWQIKDLTAQKELKREEIIKVVKEHEGLRGLVSEVEKFILTVFPKEIISWNRDILKESLGAAYFSVVREDLLINIAIPIGFVTEKEIVISEEVMTAVLRGALINLGITEEDLAKIIRSEIRLSPDKKKLTAMINQGQVKLPAEAKESEIIWNLRVDRLD